MADDLQDMLDNSSNPYETLFFYGGTEVLHYDDALHAYFKVLEDGHKALVPGVTTVTGMIDKSGPLTQWAANMAVLYLRKEIFTEKYETHDPEIPEQLYRLTYGDLDTLLNAARFNFRKVKEDASDVGKESHKWLENYVKLLIVDTNSVVPLLPEEPRAASCVEAAVKWMGRHHFRPLYSERKIYSRRHNYSGTLDTIAYITACGDPKCCPFEGTRLSLIDFKSSNRLYEEYALQTAAYNMAYEEEFPDEQIDVRVLLRLGKEDGDFEPRTLLRDRLDHDIDGFLSALGVYAWKRQLELDAKYDKALDKAAAKAAKAAATAAKPATTRRRSKTIKVKEPEFEPIPIG
jgi:hypothetical protein